ncbi:Bug family tripartite tricarboxylate transporter substrate binding protein [Hydrogenophaga sp.]|uniref:Bug family tripartite tricarboxylate transporter substrate binding protein n=1 Tax=Hydrogenophaga sp. TaxID=1904254 RepID=UPI003D1151DE
MQRRDFARAAVLLPFASSLRAQTPAWPQRPVRFILSQPAGAGPDILARYVGDQLGRLWNQGVVVENKPGGQNVIGAQAAARAPADGYTFYYATTAAMVTNAYTFKSLPYDPAKDFVPVRLVGRSPFVIAAASNFPAKDLAEAIAMAKAKPGTVSMGTEGPKTFSGMLAGSVAGMAGVQFNLVPYTKAPEAIQDVIGGRVQLVCLPDAALSAFLKSGQLKALAVSTAQRQPDMPNVPALAETFPGFEYTGWNGVFAPAGTPADVVARVNRDLETVLRQPEVAQRLSQLGSLAEQKMSVAEFDAFMRSERERWREVIKTLGITAE